MAKRSNFPEGYEDLGNGYGLFLVSEEQGTRQAVYTVMRQDGLVLGNSYEANVERVIEHDLADPQPSPLTEKPVPEGFVLAENTVPAEPEPIGVAVAQGWTADMDPYYAAWLGRVYGQAEVSISDVATGDFGNTTDAPAPVEEPQPVEA